MFLRLGRMLGAKREEKDLQTGKIENLDYSSGRSIDHSRPVRAASQARTTTHGAIRYKTDDSLGNLKLRIPAFSGKNDHDSYLEWEKRMELFLLLKLQHQKMCDFLLPNSVDMLFIGGTQNYHEKEDFSW